MEQRNKVTCQLVGLKAKSKKEMYRLLASDAHIYLPPIKWPTTCTLADSNWELEGMSGTALLTLLVYQKLWSKANSGAPDKAFKRKRCSFVCEKTCRNRWLSARV